MAREFLLFWLLRVLNSEVMTMTQKKKKVVFSICNLSNKFTNKDKEKRGVNHITQADC